MGPVQWHRGGDPGNGAIAEPNSVKERGLRRYRPHGARADRRGAYEVRTRFSRAELRARRGRGSL